MTRGDATPMAAPVIAAIGVAGPAAVLAGYLIRPRVSDYVDDAALASSIATGSGRWIASALLVPLGYAGIAVALRSLAPRSLAGPVMALTSALLGVQVGLLVGAAHGARDRGDPEAAVEAVRGWEGPLIGVVLVLGAIAWFAFARHARSALPTAASRNLVVAAAAVAVGGLLIPSSVGEYLSAAGAAVAVWTALARARSADERPRWEEGRSAG